MQKITHALVRTFVSNYQLTHVPKVRRQTGLLGAWSSIVINGILFIVKLSIGILSQSVALIADAIHTLSDLGSSVVLVVTFHCSGRPSDTKHPFGHGRVEAIGTLIVALLIIFSGIEMLRTSIHRILEPEVVNGSFLYIGIIAATIIIKELLAKFSNHLGAMINSSALKADGWHHRIDALTSVLVIIALTGQRFGFLYIDGIMGALICVFLIYTGLRIIQKEIDNLIGKRPAENLILAIKKTAMGLPEVMDVHDVIVHQYGPALVMSLHIVISDEFSLRNAHSVAEQVENLIGQKFHAHATVHMDPMNTKSQHIKEMRQFLENIISNHNDLISFHDLRTEKKDNTNYLLFDLVVNPDLEQEAYDVIKNELTVKLKERFQSLSGIIIEVEPKYAL